MEAPEVTSLTTVKSMIAVLYMAFIPQKKNFFFPWNLMRYVPWATTFGDAIKMGLSP
jgi:hypothetical protein